MPGWDVDAVDMMCSRCAGDLEATDLGTVYVALRSTKTTRASVALCAIPVRRAGAAVLASNRAACPTMIARVANAIEMILIDELKAQPRPK